MPEIDTGQWKCPKCAALVPYTPQQWLARAGAKSGATIIAMVRSKNFPCPFCGATVDLEELTKGKYDAKKCFIATAAYGSDGAEPVMILRDFRDRRLSRSAAGRRAIAIYEWLSPPVAEAIACHAWLRSVARAVLVAPVARIARMFD